MRSVGLAPWIVAASLAGGCEDVPTLTFTENDARSTVAPDVEEAAPPSGDAGGCPGANPPPAPFVCCGSVACQGLCSGQCDTCASKCHSPGEVCCAKNNNVLCIAAGSICH